MKLLDLKNSRHMEILREELSRAKKIITENQQANMYMRGIFSIIYRDNEFKNTNAMQDFIAGVVNAKSTDKDDILNALKDYTKANPEKMQDLNTEISQMTEPIHTRTSAGTSSLDADSYRAGQGRGGWQGD
jgi:spore germination protein GerM